MHAQKVREMEAAASKEAAAADVHPTPEQVRIDWTTHKKEGMRLKRLMEESSTGSIDFPHMEKLWNGTKEDSSYIIAKT